MNTLTFYQVDTFTDRVFQGNPAGVCPLDAWLDNDLMQNIAFENNLPETAFYVKNGQNYEIRWFTPTTEVDLCGHATLASAFVEFQNNGNADKITFQSKSGELVVEKQEDKLALIFPVDHIEPTAIPGEIANCFNYMPKKAFKGRDDLMLVFNSEEEILNLIPNLSEVQKLKCRGVITTAPGTKVDFVSRFFAPQSGIDEDPVTGSAHTTLIPYWSEALGPKKLVARQISFRGGWLECELIDDLVKISGQAKIYLEGKIMV